MHTLDARGYACPEPVLMARKALAAHGCPLEVLVDNKVAVGNITRFATNRGLRITHAEDGGEPFDEKMKRLTGELSVMLKKSHKLEEEIRERLGEVRFDL